MNQESSRECMQPESIRQRSTETVRLNSTSTFSYLNAKLPVVNPYEAPARARNTSPTKGLHRLRMFGKIAFGLFLLGPIAMAVLLGTGLALLSLLTQLMQWVLR